MAYSSPYPGSPPDEYYYARERYQSATPTPSPRGSSSYYYPPGSTPQRPATRSHFRTSSSGFSEYSPRPPTASPRYTSDGYYATANVSSGHHSRKHSWATPSHPPRERRSSFVYVRAATPHGESDDEIIEVDGRTYLVPGKSSRARSKRHSVQETFYYEDGRGYPTDYRSHAQSGFAYIERDIPAYEPRPSRTPANGHSRRSSTSVPQRPSTVRPGSSSQASKKAQPQTETKKPTPPPVARAATEQDAKRHKIPSGYSLKNWDPTEEPILLLGSVFDSNSLGKWIYDWTVYHHGPATPISDMAGELWLLLIQLAGKIKRGEETIERVRSTEKKEILDDFIDAGERLTDKLRKLLKTCEAPMLKASKKSSSLGKNAGVQFVETLFGIERELDKTERFMQGVRLFILRFDANCDDILKNPEK
ncbi:vegetative cell wall protein gp1 [Colletotrichum paranaense]|uniref:Vegetative cell wall protein gp1 n=1 Tax=Colletotrichum paranaense TaxID=1914294 RepID=A0ABQ9T312_9PEZI|nr:vegetative cell wall protein gp1 [Colletotrichum paranaense]KAK1546143.1 vegetative cell wall protein gp1 [Colletotrichum paranaense]